MQLKLAAFLGEVQFCDGTLTDADWKCTAECADPDWYEPAYDDSTWMNATVVGGKNGVQPWGAVSGISGDAEWIWSTDNYYYDDSGATTREAPADGSAAPADGTTKQVAPKLFAYSYCRQTAPQCSYCAAKGYGGGVYGA